MERNLAYLFSYLFHPVFMPIFGLFLVLHSNTYLNFLVNPRAKSLLYIAMAINTVILPILSILILRKTKAITSLYVIRKEERFVVFVFTIIYYISTYYLVVRWAIPAYFFSVILGGIFATLLAMAITPITKISIHMIGIGGVIGILVGLLEKLNFNVLYIGNAEIGAKLFYPLLFVAAGIVGSSRLALNQHKGHEILLGFLVGFFAEYLTVVFEIVI